MRGSRKEGRRRTIHVSWSCGSSLWASQLGSQARVKRGTVRPGWRGDKGTGR
jgi:hypothetical protein